MCVMYLFEKVIKLLKLIIVKESHCTEKELFTFNYVDWKFLIRSKPNLHRSIIAMTSPLSNVVK